MYALGFKIAGTNTTFQNRTLHIRSGEHEETVEFEGPTEMSSNEIKCQELPSNQPLEAGKAVMHDLSAVVGVLVRIDRGPTASYTGEDGELRATNGSGWITIRGLRTERLPRAKRGRASFVQFSGNVVNLEINDTQVTPNPAASYTTIGDFEGSYERGGQLRFVGTAKALFKDGNRMNPTKWETLSWARGAFLLGMIGSLLVALARFVISDLKRSSPSSWLSH